MSSDLLVERVAVADLLPYPGNARRHDLDTIRRSLREHGQWRPAVVQRSTSYVLIGNGMLAAAKLEGWTELAAHYRDVDDATARRLVLLDNRSGELGGYDNAALAELLSSLPTVEGTGYTDDDLADLLASVRAPDLDDLHDVYGDPHDDDTHVRIALSVPPDVAALWTAAGVMTGLSGRDRDVALVNAAHAHLSA